MYSSRVVLTLCLIQVSGIERRIKAFCEKWGPAYAYALVSYVDCCDPNGGYPYSGNPDEDVSA
jgi:hypothetical protein